MSRIINLTIIFLLSAATSAFSQEYHIVTPPKPARVIQHAATELTRYLRAMTEEKVTVSETPLNSGVNIILGNGDQNPVTKVLAASGKLVEPAGWATETNEEA